MGLLGTSVFAPALAASPILTGFVASPSSLVGSQSSSGTVSLSAVAPAGGVVITLSSKNPLTANVPTSVVIPAGAKSAPFSFSTSEVSASTVTALSATYAGVTKSVNVTTRPLFKLVLVSPATLNAGDAGTGTVTLDGPAPAAGANISLLSSNPAALSVPSSVFVSGGDTNARFTFTANSVTAVTAVTIIATRLGLAKTARITLYPSLKSFTVNPTILSAGDSGTGTLTLSLASTGSARVILQSSDPQVVSVPASVLVPVGQSSVPFTFTTGSVSAAASVTLTASSEGIVKTAKVTVYSPLKSFTITPTSVSAGKPVTGTVTLSLPAPDSGLQIALHCNLPNVADLPDFVTIPAGKTSTSFSIDTSDVSASTPVTSSALCNGAEAGATFMITPVVPLPSNLTIARFDANTDLFPANGWSIGRLSLSVPAPTGGVTISLSSSVPALTTLPASVAVPGGATQATFSFGVGAVSTDTPITLTATLGASQQTLSSTIITPNSALVAHLGRFDLGTSATPAWSILHATVSLTRPAPSTGATVLLAADDPSVSVTGMVQIPAGATTASFDVTVYGVSEVTPVTLKATWGNESVSTLLTVSPAVAVAKIGNLALNAASLKGGLIYMGMVTLTSPAPSGGAVVTLGSSLASLGAPTSVTIPAGQMQAMFRLQPILGAIGAGTLTATYGSSYFSTPFSLFR